MKKIIIYFLISLTFSLLTTSKQESISNYSIQLIEYEDNQLFEIKKEAKDEIVLWIKQNIRFNEYSLKNQDLINNLIIYYIEKIDNARHKEKVDWLIVKVKKELNNISSIEEEENMDKFTLYDRLINNTFIGRVFKILANNYISLLKGLLITLALAFIAVLVGSILGIIIALMRISTNKIINRSARVYIEIIRGIPLLLQLVTIYLLFNSFLGAFWAVATALFLNSSAYVAEIIRSGIQAIDKGQSEAARSLGMSYRNTMYKVILPQAVKNILPALGNEFVAVIKETSLAATFYIGDIMTVKNNITSITYLALEPFIIVGSIYLLITYGLSKVISKFEKRLVS